MPVVFSLCSRARNAETLMRQGNTIPGHTNLQCDGESMTTSRIGGKLALNPHGTVETEKSLLNISRSKNDMRGYSLSECNPARTESTLSRFGYTSLPDIPTNSTKSVISMTTVSIITRRKAPLPGISKHKDKILMPSKYGYHPRSNSPTYKRLNKVRCKLDDAIDNQVNDSLRKHHLDPHLTFEEFYDKYISGDLSEQENKPPTKTKGPSYIRCIEPRPQLDFNLDKSHYQERYPSPMPDVPPTPPTRKSLYVHLPPLGISLSEPLHHAEDFHPHLASQRKLNNSLQELVNIDQIIYEANNGELSRSGSGSPATSKDILPSAASQEEITAPIDVEGDQPVPQSSASSRSGLEDLMDHAESTSDAEELSEECKTITEEDKTEVLEEEEDKVEDIPAIENREPVKKRPHIVSIQGLSKSRAVNRMARKADLNAEEAADLYYTRDHKIISQKFINRLNEMAFGSDDSDSEAESGENPS